MWASAKSSSSVFIDSRRRKKGCWIVHVGRATSMTSTSADREWISSKVCLSRYSLSRWPVISKLTRYTKTCLLLSLSMPKKCMCWSPASCSTTSLTALKRLPKERYFPCTCHPLLQKPKILPWMINKNNPQSILLQKKKKKKNHCKGRKIWFIVVNH